MLSPQTTQNYLKPSFLKKGDTIGLISTARKISKDELQPALQIIKKLGYQYQLAKHLFEVENQFAGSSEQRAEDLHSMFLDNNVKAILCVRGGYGTVQLLSKLNLDLIRNNPKWLIGYSDVTVLHSFFHQQLHWQTLHASMPINFKDYHHSDITINSLFKSLEGKQQSYSLNTNKYNKLGTANGILVGGNLSILYSLRGTLADIDTDGKILFIEDLDEYLYHIDRIMMNLKLANKLNKLKALVVGGMSDMNDNAVPFGKTAKQIILESVNEFDFPVLFDFPAGHINDNYALNLGQKAQVTIDSKKSSLSFID